MTKQQRCASSPVWQRGMFFQLLAGIQTVENRRGDIDNDHIAATPKIVFG